MDEATVRAMLKQHFENAGHDPDLAHAMYHEDAVLEFPQSGELFIGGRELPRMEKQLPGVNFVRVPGSAGPGRPLGC